MSFIQEHDGQPKILRWKSFNFAPEFPPGQPVVRRSRSDDL